jgi:5-formyltetrahydrofolate cyclo-ligase
MIEKEKQKLREKIWKLLEEKKIAKPPLPCFGRIPNFEGSEKAAKLLKTLPEWKGAKIVFSNPDAAQQPVRELALKEGKILIMATPRLKKGYLKIDPKDVKGKEKEASTIKGGFKYGKPIKDLPKPDLIITGCVAVDKEGWRLGKGGGYGDREIKTFLKKFGKIPVITTVHELQIVEKVPHENHDTKVDYIVTHKRIIECEKEK